MIRELPWKLLASIVSIPFVANWLIERAQRTPYVHLTGYMNRWWLFNAYDSPRYVRWLPSVRVHHILRQDRGAHLHDHPWNSRTIILRGWYLEEKENDKYHFRDAGDTARILHGEYHHIRSVSEGGVWTLFFTWKYRGTWGFKVDGKKVPWREYEQLYPTNNRTD